MIYEKHLPLLMALMACQPSPESDKNNSGTQAPDTMAQSNPELQQGFAGKLVVKNEADYSPAFLALLRENTDFENFQLEGNRMIVNGMDTAYFSQEPPIGKNLVLSANAFCMLPIYTNHLNLRFNKAFWDNEKLKK